MTVLLVLSLTFPLLAGVAALFLSGNARATSVVGVAGVVGGSVLGLIAAVGVLLGGDGLALRRPWSVPGGEFYIAVDPLSAIFLVVIFGLMTIAALYGYHYMMPYGKHKSLGFPWMAFNVLLVSMALLVVARNGVLFLMAWEVMALSSFFLVTFEHEKPEVRSAGWIYLIAAHVGTAFLLAMFALLAREAGSFSFDDFSGIGAMASGTAAAIFIFSLIGFGAKAGFVPFHIWLPEAHPAAPSHVSAVMSGVMIKMGIYGIIRVLTFLGEPPFWWAVLLIGIGLTTGIVGVLFAIAQKGLKRLLAYSSVENIGIITIGIGIGVWGLSQDRGAVALLGFTGAIVHVLNHACFKGLLFLGAGSVLHATHAREMDRLGGLLKRMPVTGGLFVIASMAIVGLPPLNGFISEFLILTGSYKGVVALGTDASRIVPLIAAIAGIGLIGGLALVCFTKAFGITFLGAERSESASHAHESGWGMLAPMVVLAAACVFIGLEAPIAVRLVLPAAAQISGVPLEVATAQTAAYTGPLGSVMMVALIVTALAAGLALLRLALLRGREVTRSVTWDCGYERPSARMQYTSTSFSQPLVEVFKRVLWPRIRLRSPQGYFPKASAFRSDVPDVFAEQVYRPVGAWVEWSSYRLHWLQHGRLHLYILYIFVTLVVLLVWKVGFGA